MSEVMVLTGVLTQNADIQKVGDDSLVTLHLAVKGIEKDMWEAVVRFSIHNWFIVKYLRKGQCVAIRGYLVSLLSHDAELDEIELGAIEVLSGKGSIIAAEYKEDLINDGRRSVKYKVGDKVRIRSKEWIDAQPKSEDGAIELETNDIVPRMFEYAGKTATITKINEVLCNYKLDIDDGHWSWTDEMFEGNVKELTEIAKVSETLTLRDFFAGCALAGLLASGNRYTMAEEPGKATADAYYLADLMLKVRR